MGILIMPYYNHSGHKLNIPSISLWNIGYSHKSKNNLWIFIDKVKWNNSIKRRDVLFKGEILFQLIFIWHSLLYCCHLQCQKKRIRYIYDYCFCEYHDKTKISSEKVIYYVEHFMAKLFLSNDVNFVHSNFTFFNVYLEK